MVDGLNTFSQQKDLQILQIGMKVNKEVKTED